MSLPKVHTLHCKMDLEEFPFDTQECKVLIGSWSNHGWLMDVQAHKEMPVELTSGFEQPNDFLLRAVQTRRKVTYYSCCPEPWPLLEVVLKIEREPLMYVCGIIIPL